MGKKFNAAKSLFNSTDEAAGASAKALSGMVGGQAREQTVLTPEWLLDAIRAVAPIGLDPCTTMDNPVGARFTFVKDAPVLHPDSVYWRHGAVIMGNDGLLPLWTLYAHEGPCVYVNPPYGDLKQWMRKCYEESDTFRTPIYLLAPFRPQRRWFNEYTKGYTVVTLAPFPFVGHKSAFPAPLCLVCYNLPVPNLGKYETGRWVQL